MSDHVWICFYVQRTSIEKVLSWRSFYSARTRCTMRACEHHNMRIEKRILSKSSSNVKSDAIFEIFEKKKFKLIPHNLYLGRLMTKMKTSLTMFMMTKLVSRLERGLVLLKTNFCAWSELASKLQARYWVVTQYSVSTLLKLSLSSVQLHRGLGEIYSVPKTFHSHP